MIFEINAMESADAMTTLDFDTLFKQSAQPE
jgi:hypothetical protein